MIEIDGSYGEGGGQMLRSALALSILTQQSFHIRNIRANRPRPGLKPQHFTLISILKTISDASVEGLEKQSPELTFTPGMISGGRYQFDVGTAGSIVLIFQSIILASLQAKEDIQVQLTGGTDVKWAPSWDFFTEVFLQVLRKIGIHVHVSLQKRGYYPRGGGSGLISMKPVSKIDSLSWGSPIDVSKVQGRIHSAGLPDHISRRLKHTCSKKLMESHLNSHISSEINGSDSPGVVGTIWTEEPGGCLGCVGLGERGVPAERIGKKMAKSMIADVQQGSTVDVFLCDQILPFLVFASRDSMVRVRTLSMHAKTNMWLVEQFFNGKALFDVSEHDTCALIRVHGNVKL